MTEEERRNFEAMKKLFEDRINGNFAPKFTFNWDDLYNRTPYTNTSKVEYATASQRKPTDWIEFVAFLTPWILRVEGSRSDGKMMRKELTPMHLTTLNVELSKRGFKIEQLPNLNASTKIYKFRKEA